MGRCVNKPTPYRAPANRSSAPIVSIKPSDVVCLSHLRWDFVFQRPHHLLTRCARSHRVFFIEEPLELDDEARLEVRVRQQGVTVVVPRVPPGLSEAAKAAVQAHLMRRFLREHGVVDYVLWYYTPMALNFTRDLAPRAVIYDCMDELSGFEGAPPELAHRERELFDRAELVFTGGQTLYEAKRHLHRNIHAFPSSVDIEHFGRAREIHLDPPDQAGIPHPRLGFFGVVDERLDIELLAGVAAARPEWQLVIVGPTAKIDPAILPASPNIHYLGPKRYEDLPSYLAGWDVALLPFAHNDATRFISPTKTPEYLAAGVPVVSTSIRDVVRPYGIQGLARIADTIPEFVQAAEAALQEDRVARLRAVDAFLTQTSWDGTWTRMYALINELLSPQRASPASIPAPGVA